MNKIIKQMVYVGVKTDKPFWHHAKSFCFFCNELDWYKLSTEYQIAMIEKEVIKYVTVKQKRIEVGENHLRFELRVEIGDQIKTTNYDVPRDIYENNIYEWQKKELMMIYAMSLINWECEVVKNE